MNKEFIPYEQALELKELGFDEPCNAYYESDGRLVYSAITNTNSFWAERSIISAPLYQQAFRWFREKYELTSWIYNSHMDRFYNTILQDGRIVKSHDATTTYEEAELACLKKLIEIVKNK